MYRLKEVGIEFKLNIILLKSNVENLDGMEKIAKELNADYFVYSGIIDKLNGDKNSGNRIMMDIDLTRRIEKINSAYRKKIKTYSIDDKKKILNQNEDIYPCDAGKTSFQISAEGKLLICEFQKDRKLSLKSNNFEILWEQLDDIRKKELKFKKMCVDCKYKAFCDPCPLKVDLMKSDLYMCESAKYKYMYENLK